MTPGCMHEQLPSWQINLSMCTTEYSADGNKYKIYIDVLNKYFNT